MSKRKNPHAVALGRRGGKVGGKVKSEAKTAAARENGKKGGRPKMKLIVLTVALLLSTIACGYQNPVAPAVVNQPQPGVPTRLELTANPGQGVEGGTGTITARVLDGLLTALPNQPVRFTASLGALAASEVVTDDQGFARTTLTAPAGVVSIIATTSALETTALIAMQPTTPVQAPPAPFPVPQPSAPIPAPAPTPTPSPSAPTVTAILSSRSPSGTTVAVGGTLTFSVTVANLQAGETITAFQWDLDGDKDGVFEFTTTSSQQTSTPYTAHGLFTARVKVTTSTGRSAIGTLPFVVTS